MPDDETTETEETSSATRYSEDNPDHVPNPTDQIGNVNTRDEGARLSKPEDVSPVFGYIKGDDRSVGEQFESLLEPPEDDGEEFTPLGERNDHTMHGDQTGNAKTALPDAEPLRDPEGNQVTGLAPIENAGLPYSTPETNAEARRAEAGPTEDEEIGESTRKAPTVAQLRAYARSNDVDLPSGLNKQEIEDHLRAANLNPDDAG